MCIGAPPVRDSTSVKAPPVDVRVAFTSRSKPSTPWPGASIYARGGELFIVGTVTSFGDLLADRYAAAGAAHPAAEDGRELAGFAAGDDDMNVLQRLEFGRRLL